jgi:hypothetical protein
MGRRAISSTGNRASLCKSVETAKIPFLMDGNHAANNLPSAPEKLHRNVPLLSHGEQSAGAPQTNVNEVSGQAEKLRALFPHLPADQLNDVAETLHGHCAIAWRIYERLQREHPEVIDELMRNRTMKGKVDSSK